MTASTDLSFTILGTGALGGFYGARLQAAGATVRFIARSDAATIARDGLRVDSPLGDLHLDPVEVYRDSDAIPPSDVVCVALKTIQNHRLPTLLRPLVRPGTIILNLQNGLTMEDELAAAFPEARVIAGMCYLCSNKVGPGHIVHLDYGTVSFAPFDERDRACIEPLMQAFSAAGVEVESLPDLHQARWRKLAWNIPFNGLSVLLDADTDRIIADPDARRLAQRLMAEVARGAEACGHPFAPDFPERLIRFTEQMRPYAPSMRLDYLDKRPLELEYMYRRPLREAERHGAQLPVITALADALAFRDRHNRAAG
ncbi:MULTISPECIES: putative 2-dehydropantoate 2-reductase [unclassified Marichromatium]|uniref:putative 2-dehydropantoate 2-reductase n=1 Tax=unclassified Marichromatium TaxID=2618417 RepID=UPI000F402528|nr:putative 2-dehydropantoate 2-reductase [Marichromatium sp. AB31]RNE89763.1 putative 2-dehydropantoate 2-reductase [Marichromatium sp. AB31]